MLNVAETHIDEDGLAGIGLGGFDLVTLLGRVDGRGQDIWHRAQFVRDMRHGAATVTPDRRTLVVHVDDMTDEPTAERVRLALGLPPNQLYAA
jgi:hypothetical protein